MTLSKKRIRPKKYSEIAEVIRKRISDGDYSGRLPGINQLSTEFEVNRKTANRAILHLVKEGLLIRRAGFGTFIAGTDNPAESPVIKRVNSKRYAILIRSSDPFAGYLDLLAGCDEVISSIGGSVIYAKFDEHDPNSLLGKLRFQQIEGVIICGIIANPLLQKLQQEFSVLLIDSNPDSIPANAIVYNYYESAFQLGELIARKGKTKAAIINFFDDDHPNHTKTSFPYRLQGFTDAFNKHYIEYQIFEFGWNMDKLDQESPLKKYLYQSPEDTVLISSSTLQIFERLNCYDLIGKILLAGFGDKRSIEHDTIKGAYIAENYNLMGKRAGKTIIDILGRPRLQPQTEILEGTLVIN